MHDCTPVQRLFLLVHGRTGSEVVNLIQHGLSGSEVVLVAEHGPAGSEVPILYFYLKLTYRSYESMTAAINMKAMAQKLIVETSWLRDLVLDSYSFS